MARQFGLKERTPTLPGSVRETRGPTLEARSFIREDRDFIAGLFSGIVLVIPFMTIGAVLLYLAFVS